MKGMGFPSLTGTNMSVCVTVPAREGVRLTRGIREALGPAWQQLGGGNGTGQFGEMGWVRSAGEIGEIGGNGPRLFFQYLIPFQN
jgi:hypothetical protein